MNTTKQGDKFEERVFDFFDELISQDKFWSKKEHTKIYKKKGYFSKDRDKNIIFDVSIEIFLPDEPNYSLLVIIECKNYSNHRVPVDDVEEFYAKIQQISGANIKGIVASTNSFQDGAFKFSKSKGIGLFRYFDNSESKWLLTRSTSSLISRKFAQASWYTAYKGITTEIFRSNYLEFHGYFNDKYTNSAYLFLKQIIESNLDENVKEIFLNSATELDDNKSYVTYLDDSQIEEKSNLLLKEIDYQDGSVPLEAICNHLQEKFDIQFEYNTKTVETDISGEAILGKISFNPNRITIYPHSNQNAHREKFTLAHEIGHYTLGHAEFMLGEYYSENDIDTEKAKGLGIRDIAKLEYQANHFASSLLLPKEVFTYDFYLLISSLGLKNRGHGPLYLDDQNCNIESYFSITNSLKDRYQVSRQAIKWRLIKLNLLTVRQNKNRNIF